jgi:hypothetical protein
MANTSIATITADVPKYIDPRTHAVLDYLTAAGFIALGISMLGQHSRAAALAFANGAAVLGLSLMTDYPGGVFRRISFRTHGTVDALQAAMTATGPMLLGFAGDAEAQPFHAQAVIEAGVIGATDWDALRG